MPTAKCKVCEAKDETILAQKATIAALNEMVNLQRVLPTAAPTPIPVPQHVEQGMERFLKAVPEPEPDLEEIADRLNNDPDLPEEVAERLLSQAQALNTRVERE